jgi:hypothetical protein
MHQFAFSPHAWEAHVNSTPSWPKSTQNYSMHTLEMELHACDQPILILAIFLQKLHEQASDHMFQFHAM